MRKYLITTSILTFFSSIVHAMASEEVPFQRATVSAPTMVSAPSYFSWSGFYAGSQIGGFSGKLSGESRDDVIPLHPGRNHDKWTAMDKKYLPKTSGFFGGVYAGVNIDFGDNLIVGGDADIFVSAKNFEKRFDISDDARENTIAVFTHEFKPKWVGATRLRVGYSIGRILPYLSGGIAYGNFKDVLSLSFTGVHDKIHRKSETKLMTGYTIGGGVDFAMLDNVVLRAEYRHSNFGKKKFNDEIELNYETNDFRVGIAYKF